MTPRAFTVYHCDDAVERGVTADDVLDLLLDGNRTIVGREREGRIVLELRDRGPVALAVEREETQ